MNRYQKLFNTMLTPVKIIFTVQKKKELCPSRIESGSPWLWRLAAPSTPQLYSYIDTVNKSLEHIQMSFFFTDKPVTITVNNIASEFLYCTVPLF